MAGWCYNVIYCYINFEFLEEYEKTKEKEKNEHF